MHLVIYAKSFKKVAQSLFWPSGEIFKRILKKKIGESCLKTIKSWFKREKNTTKSDQTRPKHDQNARPDHDHDQYDQFG